LTYLERNYRGEEFYVPFSGDRISIPERLLLIGTMNPFDRSVTQVDAVRRFDHIDIEPSGEVVREMLETDSAFTQKQIDLIVKWFENAQNMLEIGLGHAFFKDVTDIDKLKLVWKYRIWPTAETILELSPANRENFVSSFDALIVRLEGESKA
jgi:5-methylcytosine-specific restriction enzyme B